METKECPYCGETIMASAKKCRYCGEWLDETAPLPDVQPAVEELAQYADKVVTVANDNVQLPMEEIKVDQSLASTQNSPMCRPVGQQAMGLNNVMPQITVNVVQQVEQENTQIQENTQVQETNVVVEETGSTTSSWWIWTQLLIIGGLVWGVSGHWWVGLITLFALTFCMMIPLLGHAMCVILALGVAVLAGVIAAAFGAPTWAAWIIAIVVGLGVGYNNIESRKTFIEE